jgi:lipopolysaccharide biosynthesis regulator YciM
MSIQQGLQQVQNAINQGDLNQALEMCQKLLFQSPGCAAASILMGSIYEQQKNMAGRWKLTERQLSISLTLLKPMSI